MSDAKGYPHKQTFNIKGTKGKKRNSWWNPEAPRNTKRKEKE